MSVIPGSTGITLTPTEEGADMQLEIMGERIEKKILSLSGGGTVRDVLLAYAFGGAENMVQAALKSMQLGQSAGQRILARLADAIPAAADHADGLLDSERQAFSPMLAILSARHEVQYSRLFRS